MGRYENGDSYSDPSSPYYTPQSNARPNVIIPIEFQEQMRNRKTNEVYTDSILERCNKLLDHQVNMLALHITSQHYPNHVQVQVVDDIMSALGTLLKGQDVPYALANALTTYEQDIKTVYHGIELVFPSDGHSDTKHMDDTILKWVRDELNRRL